MRIQVGDKYYRKRRGVLVEIPREWLNQIPTKSTQSDRKVLAKVKRDGRRKSYKFLKDLPVL